MAGKLFGSKNHVHCVAIKLFMTFSTRCVLEYGKDDNDRLTNTLGLRRMGTTLAELQNEFSDEQPAYALFRVVSYI